MSIVTIGIDLAKNVFAVHGVDEAGKPILIKPRVSRATALVQMIRQAEIFPIDMDTLSIEQDGIPGSERSGIFKPEHGEVELTLANAMHQFDS
jgi:hypothetical protein